MRLAKAELAGDDRFVFQKRLVTRPPSSREEHGTITKAEFARGEATGEFALAWRAHGNGYAIPRSALDALQQGCVVVVNVSRTVIDEVRRRFSADLRDRGDRLAEVLAEAHRVNRDPTEAPSPSSASSAGTRSRFADP